MTPGGAANLPLRDIHMPPAPPLWPLAPGWWLVIAGGLAIALGALAWRWRRRRRLRRIAQLFDAAVQQAPDGAARVAAMSDLLRRAARRIDPAADTLAGDDWLRFLDRGLPMPVFSAGAAALLRDGAFRRELSEVEVQALQQIARDRFIGWMQR